MAAALANAANPGASSSLDRCQAEEATRVQLQGYSGAPVAQPPDAQARRRGAYRIALFLGLLQDGTDAVALETTMTLCTFDRSPSLDLALVATNTLRAPRYVPLALAPVERATVSAPALRQLHAVANSVVEGLIARQRAPLDSKAWEMLGRR